MSYDHNQRNAIRLVCTVCQRSYDCTHANIRPMPFVCLACQKQSANDVSGVPMEGGATGP